MPSMHYTKICNNTDNGLGLETLDYHDDIS